MQKVTKMNDTDIQKQKNSKLSDELRCKNCIERTLCKHGVIILCEPNFIAFLIRQRTTTTFMIFLFISFLFPFLQKNIQKSLTEIFL